MNIMELEEKKSILLTFDVEDWFQVENFKNYIGFSTWNSFELRVQKTTIDLLDFLDSVSGQPRATFFILGWIADKLPELIREIHDRGHEVASHGYDHHLCTALGEKELEQDLIRSRNRLEDLTGEKVLGFRAPSFVVSDRILNKIRTAGYVYDSSYNSFAAHGRYGAIDLTGARKQKGCYEFESGFYELPVSNVPFMGRTIPLGGGGYFRLYPYFLFRKGIKSVLKKEDVFLFYAHPWEFDPDQPRVEMASASFKFRHYVNLHKTIIKLERMIQDFSANQFLCCRDLVSQNTA